MSHDTSGRKAVSIEEDAMILMQHALYTLVLTMAHSFVIT